VTQAPREISLELEDDEKARQQVKSAIDDALAGKTSTLWIVDKRGRDIAIPSAKIAYVEIGSSGADRRIGFGG
jgi:hypothetical protein